MIFVENSSRFGEVQLVFRRFQPRQFQNKLEIRANDVIVRRRRRQSLQSFQLALSFRPHFLRKLCFLEPLAQQFGFGGLACFILAELFLDRAHLLAQNVIALRFVHLSLRFGSDLRTQLHDLELMREPRVGEPQ